MAKYTKGDWKRDGNFIVSIQKDGTEVTICKIGNPETVTLYPSHQAADHNAALIRRAPKMYEAIMALLDRGGMTNIYGTDQLTGQTFDKLLKKAIGRSE